MANTKLKLKTQNNPANIYFRLTNGRKLDLEVRTNVFVNPIHWDSQREKIKEVIEIKNRNEINSKLAKLKISILDDFNLDFCNGEIIDKTWLNNKIKSFFDRPKEETNLKLNNKNIYLIDYAKYWIEQIAPTRKVSASKYMSDSIIRDYERAYEKFQEFEGKNKTSFKNVDGNLLDKYSMWLQAKDYSPQTIKRNIKRIKFFCERADEDGINVNKNYQQQVFVAEKEIEYKEPYLNEFEISSIFKLDLTHDDTLDNVRDNFIIGLWTGLRISDFLKRLDLSNISDGYIEVKTKKTGSFVSIPIHKQVQAILNKRGGFLPQKLADQTFNEHIKTVCQLCNIDELMVGGVTQYDEVKDITRKVIKTYKKYELITSHICRRSFATNHIGKIPNPDICQILGWSNENMLFKYNKTTNRDSANKLKQVWENE
jgi:integrase